MNILPPGTLLQLLYLEERLRNIQPGHFVEIGPGKGDISSLLLSLGWTGTVFELEPTTTTFLERRFSMEIGTGRYSIRNSDWLTEHASPVYDLVISCMVMEHLDSEQESQFIRCAVGSLKPSGTFISLVPGSPSHWGIEDEIAGHIRRYTRGDIKNLLPRSNWQLIDIAGLTWPISNLLLPISNWLVRRNEAKKLALTLLERTKKSGIRDVAMKTRFPAIFALVLNKASMYPFHILQKLSRKSENALVLYFEARKVDQS